MFTLCITEVQVIQRTCCLQGSDKRRDREGANFIQSTLHTTVKVKFKPYVVNIAILFGFYWKLKQNNEDLQKARSHCEDVDGQVLFLQH